MLVTLKEILKDAEEKKYGVGLFNILNLEMAKGIIAAAEEEKSPIILGVAEVHLPVIGFDYANLIMQKIAKESKVPVCLHFDHGTDFNLISEAIKSGFTSVMYDGSSLPYEKNIENTLSVVKEAEKYGCNVEAELGHVGGGEGSAAEADDTMYTEVSKVNDFLAKTRADALAVAIGTVHGVYKSTPKLDISRLREIYEISEKPLVLHGGSGLSDDDFKSVVENGIRKVNICTEMCLGVYKTYYENYKDGKSFEETVISAADAVKEIVKHKMRVFGSSGKC